MLTELRNVLTRRNRIIFSANQKNAIPMGRLLRGAKKLPVNNYADSYCLGIESTADDFGVAILSFEGKILSNANDAYMPKEGGIHPREAARHHAEVAEKVLAEAFEKAAIRPQEINLVAFSQGPGLGPCLRTGATAARALASYLDVPLVGVNHCVVILKSASWQLELGILLHCMFREETL